ncbi:MAG: Maf family protein [Pyrinomonadaceae bacterium]
METEQERQATGAQGTTGGDGELHIERLMLASGSPRRADILRAAGWPFDICAPDIDESRRPQEDAVAYVERLALAKAKAGAALNPSRVVLGADTIVLVKSEILGKPRDEDDARRMLRLLSGRYHEVITGIALVRRGAPERGAGNERVGHERTSVRFASMSEDEIEWYLKTGEAMDKAGAYAIQGQAARFIEEIKGDYLNVVGLPVRLLYKLLQE